MLQRKEEKLLLVSWNLYDALFLWEVSKWNERLKSISIWLTRLARNMIALLVDESDSCNRLFRLRSKQMFIFVAQLNDVCNEKQTKILRCWNPSNRKFFRRHYNITNKLTSLLISKTWKLSTHMFLCLYMLLLYMHCENLIVRTFMECKNWTYLCAFTFLLIKRKRVWTYLPTLFALD